MTETETASQRNAAVSEVVSHGITQRNSKEKLRRGGRVRQPTPDPEDATLRC
jgi:hypothetical protein